MKSKLKNDPRKVDCVIMKPKSFFCNYMDSITTLNYVQ